VFLWTSLVLERAYGSRSIKRRAFAARLRGTNLFLFYVRKTVISHNGSLQKDLVFIRSLCFYHTSCDEAWFFLSTSAYNWFTQFPSADLTFPQSSISLAKLPGVTYLKSLVSRARPPLPFYGKQSIAVRYGICRNSFGTARFGTDDLYSP